MISFKSYKQVNNLEFGSSIENTKQAFGKPNEENVDNDGEVELSYDSFIIRFNKHLEFNEFTLLPEINFKINGKLIGWTYKDVKPIIKMDSNPLESYGFIVLLDLGIALTGFHDGDDSQKAIHFFSKGLCEIYRDDTQPFDIEKHHNDNSIGNYEVFKKNT